MTPMPVSINPDNIHKKSRSLVACRRFLNKPRESDSSGLDGIFRWKYAVPRQIRKVPKAISLKYPRSKSRISPMTSAVAPPAADESIRLPDIRPPFSLGL